MKSEAKHRERGHAPPAIQVPASADEFYFRAQNQFENGAGLTAIELLRQLQNGVSSPVLAIRRAPNGNVDGFLLDLVRDEHDTKKCARGARADVNFFSFSVLFEPS